MLESAALSFAKKYAQHTRDSWLVEAKKEDPKAKVRNRPECIFDNTSKLVKDNKDHFPIDTLARAKNALAQVNKYDEVPEWFNGDLKKLMKMVVSAVKAKYPEINVDVKKDTSIKESVYLNEEEEEQEDEGKDEGDSGEGEGSGEDMDSDNSSDSDSEEDEMTVETAVAMLKDAFDADELEELKKLLSSEEGEKAEETETEEEPKETEEEEEVKESVDPELKNIKATDPRFADVLNRINAKTRAGKTSKIADINDEMNSETDEEDEE